MEQICGKSFDFEIGDLVESPCRTCPRNDGLPGCAVNCSTIEGIRAILSSAVGSRHPGSPSDVYHVSMRIFRNQNGQTPI